VIAVSTSRWRHKPTGPSLWVWASLVLASQAMGQYAVKWSTIDGGGTTSSAGGYALSGTIAQPDASPVSAMTSGSYALTGGFWMPLSSPCLSYAPADFNRDCHVDASDLECLTQLATGPSVPYNPQVVPGACSGLVPVDGILPADFDADKDIDQEDFGIFQRCFSGSIQIADPTCAD